MRPVLALLVGIILALVFLPLGAAAAGADPAPPPSPGDSSSSDYGSNGGGSGGSYDPSPPNQPSDTPNYDLPVRHKWPSDGAGPQRYPRPPHRDRVPLPHPPLPPRTPPTALTLRPDRAGLPAVVTASGSCPPTGYSTVSAVQFDGRQVASVVPDATNGRFEGTFAVPRDASSGGHAAVTECGGNATFTVVPPLPPPPSPSSHPAIASPARPIPLPTVIVPPNPASSADPVPPPTVTPPRIAEPAPPAISPPLHTAAPSGYKAIEIRAAAILVIVAAVIAWALIRSRRGQRGMTQNIDIRPVPGDPSIDIKPPHGMVRACTVSVQAHRDSGWQTLQEVHCGHD